MPYVYRVYLTWNEVSVGQRERPRLTGQTPRQTPATPAVCAPTPRACRCENSSAQMRVCVCAGARACVCVWEPQKTLARSLTAEISSCRCSARSLCVGGSDRSWREPKRIRCVIRCIRQCDTLHCIPNAACPVRYGIQAQRVFYREECECNTHTAVPLYVRHARHTAPTHQIYTH